MALASAAVLPLLASCSGDDSAGGFAAGSHADYADRISELGIEETALGRRWLEAAELALEQPTMTVPPHAEEGALLAHEARALGFAFEAAAGQELVLRIDRAPVPGSVFETAGNFYVDVFAIDESGTDTRYEPLEEISIDGTTMRVPLPERRRYVVRLQPELLTGTLYRLTLELESALPFPVSDHWPNAVRSFFGDPRDEGARSHEGVDIFAARMTPVVAVAEGRAVPQQNDLGGNVVWLNTPGVSYYYAHLEHAALDRPRRVQAGEVLGYVGNTGNARTTAPHLHFGIYRWGRGAVDPLPLLRSGRFDAEPPTENFAPHFVQTQAEALNVRNGPSIEHRVLGQMRSGAVGWAAATSGDWLRLRSELAASAWIHGAYQTPLDQPIEEWRAAEPALLMESPAADALPVASVPRGAVLESLGSAAGRLIVRTKDGSASGWLTRADGGSYLRSSMVLPKD